jgi:TRAP-type mannitol/chloroaromatic compound transport system permease large subunit
LLRRGYDKTMVTGVIQAGSTLGILIPPSVVLVLYGMIARQPVGNLWMAGVFPGLLMAGLFILYIVVRCLDPAEPRSGAVEGGARRVQPRREAQAAARRARAAGDLHLDDRPLPDRRDQPCREFGRRRRRFDPRRLPGAAG